MSEEIAIKVDHVSKDFVLPHEKITSVKSAFTGMFRGNGSTEKQHALKDISFEIKKGEFFGIVGRNGSGKSTMLKILANIYQPTTGRVHTTGKLVPFIELGVGFNPELTGRENVFLNGAMLGFSRAEIGAMYDDIVAFAELERFMDQKLKNYSSGMQVRLAFSMATRSEADILLVDEVLAVGDSDFQAKCFNFFKQLKRQKKTVVFVSHDMNAVREYCDRALLIENSELVVEGSPSIVSEKYSELFMHNQAAQTTDAQQDRSGDGSATVIDPKITHTQSGDIELQFSIDCAQSIDDPIVGFFVTNAAGLQVCGTNTQLLGTKVKSFEVGKRYGVRFTVDNIFSDGEYQVTIALLANNGSVIADWWTNPVQILIKKPQHVPYLVDAPIKVSIGG